MHKPIWQWCLSSIRLKKEDEVCHVDDSTMACNKICPKVYRHWITINMCRQQFPNTPLLHTWEPHKGILHHPQPMTRTRRYLNWDRSVQIKIIWKLDTQSERQLRHIHLCYHVYMYVRRNLRIPWMCVIFIVHRSPFLNQRAQVDHPTSYSEQNKRK